MTAPPAAPMAPPWTALLVPHPISKAVESISATTKTTFVGEHLRVIRNEQGEVAIDDDRHLALLDDQANADRILYAQA